MIRIVIADDHPFMRDGVKRLLGLQRDMHVLREVADGRAALRAVEECELDVLVLDLSLPLVNGMEVLRRVHASQPGVRVVVLSMYPAALHEAQMRTLGAAAYVSKDDPPEELVRAVRAVAAGEDYQRANAPNPPAAPPHRGLSAREHQVFTLIAQGSSVAEIACELHLSSSTVSNHLAAVREKLAVRTIAEIVRYAIDAGLVGPALPH